MLSTLDGRQAYPSKEEAEQKLIKEAEGIKEVSISEAKFLKFVTVRQVEMPLYQIYREDTSSGNQHLIYVDQKRANSPEEAVKRSDMVIDNHDVVVVQDDDHELVKVNKDE